VRLLQSNRWHIPEFTQCSPCKQHETENSPVRSWMKQSNARVSSRSAADSKHGRTPAHYRRENKTLWPHVWLNLKLSQENSCISRVCVCVCHVTGWQSQASNRTAVCHWSVHWCHGEICAVGVDLWSNACPATAAEAADWVWYSNTSISIAGFPRIPENNVVMEVTKLHQELMEFFNWRIIILGV